MAGRYTHTVEKAKPLQSRLTLIDQHFIVSVALRHIKFTPNDITARTVVSNNINALNVDPRTFVDKECDADGENCIDTENCMEQGLMCHAEMGHCMEMEDDDSGEMVDM